jgi:hypothetical protein
MDEDDRHGPGSSIRDSLTIAPHGRSHGSRAVARNLVVRHPGRDMTNATPSRPKITSGKPPRSAEPRRALRLERPPGIQFVNDHQVLVVVATVCLSYLQDIELDQSLDPITCKPAQRAESYEYGPVSRSLHRRALSLGGFEQNAANHQNSQTESVSAGCGYRSVSRIAQYESGKRNSNKCSSPLG